MSDSQQPKAPPEVAHDDREIHAGAVVRFAAILALATAVVLAATWSLARTLRRQALSAAPAAAPMATELPVAPPAPRLQPHPAADLRALREEEERELTSYGWIDRDGRVARIPIDRAMTILAERGLPTRRHGPPSESAVARPTDGSLEPPATTEEPR